MTKVEFSDGPVSVEQMNDVTDVVMSAIHQSFPNQVLDGHALTAAFVAISLGILRDIGQLDPKGTVKSFVDAANLDDIKPFSYTHN